MNAMFYSTLTLLRRKFLPRRYDFLPCAAGAARRDREIAKRNEMIRTFHFELLFKDTCIYGFSFLVFLFSNRAMAMVQPAKCARYTLQGTVVSR